MLIKSFSFAYLRALVSEVFQPFRRVSAQKLKIHFRGKIPSRGESVLVYCTKCGTKNADDAEVCVKCGEPLRATRAYARRAERRREERDMCFGPSRSGYYWGIFIGLIIILWGSFEFLKAAYPDVIPSNLSVWPLIIIALGIVLLISILSRPRR